MNIYFNEISLRISTGHHPPKAILVSISELYMDSERAVIVTDRRISPEFQVDVIFARVTTHFKDIFCGQTSCPLLMFDVSTIVQTEPD